MKKKNIILLIILLLVAIIISVASVFVVNNWNKISTAYYVLTDKGAELEQKYEKNEEKLQESMKDLGVETIRPLTEEESNKLNSGEISKEEAIDLILGRNEENQENIADNAGIDKPDAEKDKNSIADNAGIDKPDAGKDKNSTANSEDGKNKETSDEYKKKNEEISQLLGELYVLKSQFSAELSAIEKWVKKQYRILCDEYGGAENIPSSAKVKVGKKAYEKALALEDECDKKVEEILSRVKVLLKETNQSITIVDEIRVSYENEKSKAISYFMSQF